MDRILKSGAGWRLGWNPNGVEFKGLVGTDDWAIELTEAEFEDFCRLLEQLATTMGQLAEQLMDEEKISCEAESERLWLEVEGYSHTYGLRLLLLSGRGCEGAWGPEAVPHLLRATQMITVF